MATMIRDIGDRMVQALDDLKNGKIAPDQARAMAGVDFANDPSDEALSKAVSHKGGLRDVAEDIARNESTAKQCKALISSVCESAGEERMSGAFTRRNNGATYKVTDMSELHRRCAEAGITDDAFFAACGGISSKSAAELMGLSESAFLESHGDIIEKAEKGPTWKAV